MKTKQTLLFSLARVRSRHGGDAKAMGLYNKVSGRNAHREDQAMQCLIWKNPIGVIHATR